MSIRSRFALTALAGVLVATGLAVAPPPPASAAEGTTIQSISITVGDRTLVGAQLTGLTVRVHLTDPVGVLPAAGAMYDNYWPCPCIALASFDQEGRRWKASPQAWGGRLIPLQLGSGTAQDGVWVGRSILGADDAGFWRPTVIHAGTLVQPPQPDGEIFDGFDFVPVPTDLALASQLHVRGDDWPVFSVIIPSAITPYGTPFVVSGYARTLRTHRPVAGLRVLVMPNGDGPMMGEVGIAVRTSSTGRWVLSSIDPTPYWSAYWAPDRLNQPVSFVTAKRVHVRAVILSRTVSATTVRVGQSITVSGRMGPPGATVVLQRYYGGAWRTVSRSLSNRSTYSLLATPPRGTWPYRVVVPGTWALYGTTGAAFRLRAV